MQILPTSDLLDSRPSRPCPTLSSTRSAFLDWRHRQPLNPIEPPWYEPVCPVVWQGRSREAPPYPDQCGLSGLSPGLVPVRVSPKDLEVIIREQLVPEARAEEEELPMRGAQGFPRAMPRPAQPIFRPRELPGGDDDDGDPALLLGREPAILDVVARED